MYFTINEIRNIIEEKINLLKENQVAEDKHLEYKLTLPGEKYEDRKLHYETSKILKSD